MRTPNILRTGAAIAAGATLFVGANALKGCAGSDGFGFGPEEHTEIETAESVIERITFPTTLTVVRGEGTGESSTQTRAQIESNLPGVEQLAWIANKTILTWTDKKAGAKVQGAVDVKIESGAIDAEPYIIESGEFKDKPGIRVNINVAGISTERTGIHTLEAYGENDILPRGWTFLTGADGTAIRTSTAIDLAATGLEKCGGRALLASTYAGTQEKIKEVYEIVSSHIAQMEDGQEFAEKVDALLERPIDINFYKEVAMSDKHTTREEVDLVHDASSVVLPDPVGTPDLAVSENTHIDDGADECSFTPEAAAQQADDIIRANQGIRPQL